MYYISVIIPLYNAEKYICGCVDSILNQTLHNVEVVIVNDCSTDGGMELCRSKYGDMDNVLLIDQEKNSGPAAARNRGIECAHGEYIAFADSDDAILPDAYKSMYTAAKITGADVLHAMGVVYPLIEDMPDDLLELTDDQMLKVRADVASTIDRATVLDDNMDQRLTDWLGYKYMWNIWNKLFKRSFLDECNLRFNDMRLAEDQIFCFGALIKARRYVVLPGSWYIYRLSNESLSRGKRTISMLERGLRSQFQTVPAMRKEMEGVDFFKDHPDRGNEAMDFVLYGLESSFVSVCYRAVGRDEVMASPSIQGLFDEYYGDKAAMAKYLFCQAHDRDKSDDDDRDKYTSVSFWAEQKKVVDKKYKPEHIPSKTDDFKRLERYPAGIYLERYERVRRNHPCFSVTLYEPVNPDLLKESVDKALVFLPWMLYTPAVDTEWSYYTRQDVVYLCENPLPVVIKETEAPIRPVTESSNYHAFAISYSDNTVRFNFNHTITDGKGMSVFFEAVMYQYLSKLYGERETPLIAKGDPDKGAVYNYNNIELDYGLLDPSYSFDRFIYPSLKIQTSEEEFTETGEYAEVITPCGEFVAFSKDRGSTPAVTAFLLIAEMFERLFPDNEAHISANMMVDTRKVLDAVDSVRNCVYEARIGVPGKLLCKEHFEDNAKNVRQMMKEQTADAYHIVNGMMQSFKIAHPQTFVLSYAMRSGLNAYADAVKEVRIREGGIAKVEMIEYNGDFIFSFIFNKKSSDYANNFIKVMEDYGLDVRLSYDSPLMEEE